MEEKKNNKKLKAFIIISIIVVIVAVGIIASATLLNNNSSNSNSNSSSINSNSNSNNNSNSSTLNYPPSVKKPIIYLYPENTLELTVKLGKLENATYSYPEYKDGWHIIAHPDGTLIDKNTGRKLYSLYWEGLQNSQIDFDEGFVIKGNEIVDFLEEKLAILGLSEFEAEEFIIYWLPELEKSKYIYIRFATIDEINENMPLEFSVEPDTIIRVLMQYKILNDYIAVKEQKLEAQERTGFVVVEWGGTEIK